MYTLDFDGLLQKISDNFYQSDEEFKDDVLASYGYANPNANSIFDKVYQENIRFGREEVLMEFVKELN